MDKKALSALIFGIIVDLLALADYSQLSTCIAGNFKVTPQGFIGVSDCVDWFNDIGTWQFVLIFGSAFVLYGLVVLLRDRRIESRLTKLDAKKNQ